MEYTGLLHKLLAIEQAIGVVPNSKIREMVEDAEDCLLQIQKERAESLLTQAWRNATPDAETIRRAF